MQLTHKLCEYIAHFFFVCWSYENWCALLVHIYINDTKFNIFEDKIDGRYLASYSWTNCFWCIKVKFYTKRHRVKINLTNPWTDNNFSAGVSKGHRSDVITVELAVPCRILEFYRPLPLLCYRCRATLPFSLVPFLCARRDIRRRSRITLLLSDIQ